MKCMTVCSLFVVIFVGFVSGCDSDTNGNGSQARPEEPFAESSPSAPGGWEKIAQLTNYADFELNNYAYRYKNVEWDGLNFSGAHSYESKYIGNDIRKDVNISGRVSADGRILERFSLESTSTFLELTSQEPMHTVYEVVNIPISGTHEPMAHNVESPSVAFRRSERPESAGEMIRNYRLAEGERWHTDLEHAMASWENMRNVTFNIRFSQRR